MNLVLEIFLIIGLLVVVAGIFILPVRKIFPAAMFGILLMVFFSTWLSAPVLVSLYHNTVRSVTWEPFQGLCFVIDQLSAFFVLVVNITVITGMIYGGIYLKDAHLRKPVMLICWHYFNLLLLHASMLAVCMLRETFPFLVMWEMMTLSSFFLVIFESEERTHLKTGINYLVQMHLGMFFILTGFALSSGNAGFDGLTAYFSGHHAFPAFILFFLGYGIKAGFFPLHTWLPDAHPAAPSHVSGIMSGVMIKMGIYGLLRVLLSMRQGLFEAGLFLLVLSLVSAVYGVLQAIVQHDLKKLLAYHSIENIGIIGMGLGLGCMGLSLHQSLMAILGFGGALLHVLNHSLFKSLLFYGSGVVYQAMHTRNINTMGGLIRPLPVTAGFFLLASVAICGLPPLNGFISEFLLYYGMFGSLHGVGFYMTIILLLGIIGLALTGGLALFCFAKAFSIVFLGESRNASRIEKGKECSWLWLPYLVPGLLIVGIGLFPFYLTRPVFNLVTQAFPDQVPSVLMTPLDTQMTTISRVVLIITALAGMFLLLRFLYLRKKPAVSGPTWACGYTAGSPAMQYTATSFSDNVAGLAGAVVNVRKESEAIGELDIFPKPVNFVSHSRELLEIWLIDKPLLMMRNLMRRIAFLQTGQIQHYILYPFIFILLIFLLTLLNWI